MNKVLQYDHLSYTDEMVALLEKHNIAVTMGYAQVAPGRPVPRLGEDRLIEVSAGHVGLIGSSGSTITRRVIESLPDLRVISKVGIGFDVIDVKAATDNGVMVTTTPVPSEIAIVAEHAVSLLLALMKHLWFYDRARLRDGYWKDRSVPMWTLRERVVGIVGLGRIGSSVARHLQHFGAFVIANDVREVQVPGVEMVDLDTLMRDADAITVHVAADDPSTHGLISERRIALMKPDAVLVNTSRGIVIDQRALADALRERRISAAALDVFDYEPPAPDDPLFELPNLLCTPHAAAFSPTCSRDMSLGAAQNVIDVVEGRVPEYLLNTEVLSNLRS